MRNLREAQLGGCHRQKERKVEKKKARETDLTGFALAGRNILHHKPPKFLMGKQIKHLVSSSSF
jgi:hypothetical protein